MTMIQKHCHECGAALIEKELEGEGIEPSNTLMCNFTAFVKDDSELSPNGEIDSYEWFTPEEAQKNIRPDSLAQRFLNAYLDE